MFVRPYESKDFDDCDWLQRSFYLCPATREEMHEKLRHPSWVAVEDQVVGCLITCPHADKTLIWSIVVAASCRGRGIGSALMEAAEKHYASCTLTLYVEPQNPAKRLYEKRGWRAAQLIKGFYGKGYDAVEMYKVCE